MTTSSSSLWQDLIAGGIAGTAGVVIGHPFDTIKVRLQQQQQQQQIQPPKTKIVAPTISKPSLSSSSSILRGKLHAAPHAIPPSNNNLYRGLYRGIGAPLVTAALINASVFCVYGSASRMWDHQYSYYYHHHHSNSNDKNSSVSSTTTTTATTTTTTTITKHAVCGLITGMITSLLLCPVEHVKIRLQTLQQQGSSSASSSSLPRSLSSFDVAKKLLLYSSDHGHGHYGGLQGIYRGLFVTCLRQGPSLAIYFPVYHILKDVFVGNNTGNININNDNNNNKNGNDRKDPSSSSSSSASSLWWSSALAGGLAGSFAWTIVYPIDVIKSRIQSLPMETPSKKRSFCYIARHIHRNEGGVMKMILSRGLAVTILRAFPVNGTIFFVYENVNQWLLLNNNNFENNSNNIAENYNREATDIVVGDQEYSGVRNNRNRNRNHNIPRRRSTLRVLDVDVKQKPTELTN